MRILPQDDPGDLPLLSIIVPARNESANIERCVRSLLAQHLRDYEIIVVDDRSTDDTREIVERLAGESTRLRLIAGADLPEGWVGKPWALVQGAQTARGSWLLFTDADSFHDPRAAASALAFAIERRVSLLTIATHQELGSFWERALLPSILGMVLFATGPLDRLNDPLDRRHALANGQYIMIERGAYEALGTHAVLRGEIAEDLELARLIKRDGRFRMLIADGELLVSVRMYHSFLEIWHGFVKNVYVGANGSLLAIAGGFAFTSIISWVPPLLAFVALCKHRRILALEAVLCTLSVAATSRWAIGLTRAPRRLGLYAPLGLAIFSAITATSTLRVLSGRGVEWRGRRYTGRYQGERP